MKLPFATLLCLFSTLGFAAEETPTITITKGDKITIAVGKFDGPDAALAAKTLQNDLAMSGYFTVVSADRAQYVAGASAGGGPLPGKVTDPAAHSMPSNPSNPPRRLN